MADSTEEISACPLSADAFSQELNHTQCPVCKADVTKPPPDDHEAPPSATEPEVQDPPPTERTPLINDRS